jgi:hypothetical protein
LPLDNLKCRVLEKEPPSVKVQYLIYFETELSGLFENIQYSSPHIMVIKLRRMKLLWNMACMKEKRNACGVLLGKPDGKQPLKRSRHRWENNIKNKFKEVGCEGMDWILLA